MQLAPIQTLFPNDEGDVSTMVTSFPSSHSHNSTPSPASGASMERIAIKTLLCEPPATKPDREIRGFPIKSLEATEQNLALFSKLRGMGLNEWQAGVVLCRYHDVEFGPLSSQQDEQAPLSKHAIAMRVQRLKNKYPEVKEMLDRKKNAEFVSSDPPAPAAENSS